MRAVTGPLQTGTYIVEAASISGDESTLKLNKDQSKLALTKNHQSEAVKVRLILIIWKIRIIVHLC